MGNPFKGDVGFEVEAVPYILSLRTNALAQVQADFGTGFEIEGNRKFLLRLMSCAQTFADLRTVIFHGLQEHHDDTIKSKNDAGNLMDRLGRPDTIRVVNETLEWAFPPKQEEGAGSGPKETPESSGPGAASS